MRTIDLDKKQRIIDAAAQLFAERHYHEVRMDDIAARAGVAKGTLYLHFADKEALYLGLILYSGEQICDRIEASCSDSPTAEDKVLRFVREIVGFLQGQPYFLDLITHAEARQSEKSSPSLLATRERLHLLVRTMVDELVAGREWSETDRTLAVLALLGMTREALRVLPRPWPSDLPKRITRQFLHGLEAGLR